MQESEQVATANFTQDFEAALIGLQLNNTEVPTFSPHQYAVALAAGIYAAQRMLTRGEILPPESAEVSFNSFLNQAAVHYAENLVLVATENAREVLAGLEKQQEDDSTPDKHSV